MPLREFGRCCQLRSCARRHHLAGGPQPEAHVPTVGPGLTTSRRTCARPCSRGMKTARLWTVGQTPPQLKERLSGIELLTSPSVSRTSSDPTTRCSTEHSTAPGSGHVHPGSGYPVVSSADGLRPGQRAARDTSRGSRPARPASSPWQPWTALALVCWTPTGRRVRSSMVSQGSVPRQVVGMRTYARGECAGGPRPALVNTAWSASIGTGGVWSCTSRS